MTGEGAKTSGGYDTGAYCPPARASGPSWARIGFAAAVLAVMVAAITMWIIHLQATSGAGAAGDVRRAAGRRGRNR